MANTIQSSFGLNINPLKAAANNAVGVVSGMSRKINSNISGLISSPLTKIGGAVASYFTYETFRSGIEGVIEAGNQMVKLRDQTGITAGSLAMLKALSSETDTDFSSLAGSVNKMQRNLAGAARAGGPVATAINGLGIDFGKLLKMKPEEQFKTIGENIARLPSAMSRTAAATAVFGKSGAELLPLFRDIGRVDFGNLSEKARVLAANADTLHEISIEFKKAKSNLEAGFVGLTTSMTPLLLAVSKTFSSRSALEYGQTLGIALKDAGEVFIGIWRDPVGLVAPLTNALVGGFLEAGDYLISGIKQAISVWDTGMFASIQGLGDILAGTLVKGFQGPIAYAQAGIERLAESMPGFGGFRTSQDDTSLAEMKEQRARLMADRARLKPDMDKINADPRLKFGKSGRQTMDAWDILTHRLANSGKAISDNEAKPKFESFDQKYARILANGVKFGLYEGGATAVELISRGTKQLQFGLGNTLEAMKNLKGEDILGAGPFLAMAKQGFKPLMAVGAAVLASYTSQAVAVAKDSPFKKFADFQTAGKIGSGLSASGLSASAFASGGIFDKNFIGPVAPLAFSSRSSLGNSTNLGTGAYGQTPLLSAAERRRAEDQRVAMGQTRTPQTQGAYNAVRAGDHNRERAAKAEQARKELGAEGTNKHLSDIYELLYSQMADQGG